MIEDHLLLGYIASEETYEDRTVIIEEGSKGEWIFVVLEGRVKVKKKTEKGKVTLDTLKEGDIFGEMVLLEQRKGVRTASVVADGRVRVGVLDTQRVVRDYESLSPQLKDLIRTLIVRLKETTARVSAMAAGAD
ncbi:MAG: cyclic nucleotide-binding domain-containing protein [Deltaproteobacteria bacterium]|nr:cyclic nucleotide-binding domain-containing protein [Deltaproteobacteria bacterium]MBW1922587.1 cyclic nucleotide-binding domain-containing protein [Deltaproteobacteria bacterium]MBW1951003.1 cyclic nucleotide-binding domain-containing protein [Deltaproteobacteria bacterium]MBW2007782.1 cyclic nucleotide-binding domain-containing protein [Deltaproteobacteria bacterium]MBW2103713.1 cyclic nucleotide-binding domain-containing protein [Deltaproteobacteria bacterium]